MSAAPAVLPPPPREAQRLGATIALSVLMLGMAMAVASTVVLLRVLMSRDIVTGVVADQRQAFLMLLPGVAEKAADLLA